MQVKTFTAHEAIHFQCVVVGLISHSILDHHYYMALLSLSLFKKMGDY